MNSKELFPDFLHSYLSHISEKFNRNYYVAYDENKQGFQLINDEPSHDHFLIILMLKEHVGKYGYDIDEQGFMKEI